MVGHTCVLHWPLGDVTANILYRVMAFIYSVWEISCFTALIHGLWYSKYQRAQRWRGSACLHFQGCRGGHCRLVEARPMGCLLVWLCAQRLFTQSSREPVFSIGSRQQMVKAAPPLFFFPGFNVSRFSPLPCKLVQIKKRKWINSIFKI